MEQRVLTKFEFTMSLRLLIFFHIRAMPFIVMRVWYVHRKRVLASEIIYMITNNEVLLN